MTPASNRADDDLDSGDALATLDTPAALIDPARMRHNIGRMQQRADALNVRLRPHVKTSKCAQVVRAQLAAGAHGITVSTLKEATQFFAGGITDILYAVGIAASKLPAVLALRRHGCDLKIVTDSVAGADAIVAFGRQHAEAFEVWIEIDTDGHRSGIAPEDNSLLDVARALHDGGMRLGGVLTHAGSSYDHDTPTALRAVAEQERAGIVRAAARLREAGLPCPVVSLGSTPTALSFERLDGVSELRAGVYVFFDLVMRNIGVCRVDDIALSVLTSVIGHQADKGWAIVDAGWMAMSRDRGTANQKQDFGYGQVCALDGTPIAGCTLSGANQEHGIVSFADAPAGQGETTGERRSGGERANPGGIVTRLPVGARLRILPNHACATGAQFPQYHALDGAGRLATWERFHGW